MINVPKKRYFKELLKGIITNAEPNNTKLKAI
jgi:hypothetical protein